MENKLNSSEVSPVLILDPPDEITFEGPFVKHTKSSLKINNPNDKRIAFAIKTTAPRIFTVSPNSSIVQPHEEILVEISTQPMDKSTLAISYGFKLMVQAIFVDSTIHKENISNAIRHVPRDQISSLKLKTAFIEEGKPVTTQQPTGEKLSIIEMVRMKRQNESKLHEKSLEPSKVSEYEKKEAEHLQRIATLEEENASLKNDLESKLSEYKKNEEEHLRNISKLKKENESLKEELVSKEKEKAEMKQNFEKERQMFVSNDTVVNSDPVRLQLQNQVAHLSIENMKLKEQVKELQDQARVMEDSWRISHKEISLSKNELGRGGWGVIWIGEFRGQKVAVKQMHELLKSKEYMELLHREINTMSQLRHPNLLQFIGAVLDHPSGNPMIITEVMDTSLRKAYESKELTPDPSCRPVILSIMRDVAVGLNYLHCLPDPIIHRDVSSANVLLESKGPRKWKTKISDFGSAKFARAAVTELPGAILYSAPESLQSVLDSDDTIQSPLMDSFSFGILLCEVLTCRYPDRRVFREMLESLCNVDESLHVLAVRCTEREPHKRPNMEEILLIIETKIDQ